MTPISGLFVLLAVASSALAAPTDDWVRQDVQRIKKSSGPLASQMSPIALYLAPHGTYPSQFRAEEPMLGEIMERMPRSYYDSGALGSSSSPAMSPPAGLTSGLNNLSGGNYGAYSSFPNAHLGMPAIPLLLSCSPNVNIGQLMKSSGYQAYRSVEPEENMDMKDTMMEKNFQRE